MGYQSISNFNAVPYFAKLVAGAVTTAPVFAFKLAPTGSELFLGGTDTNLFTGAFTFTPVTTQVRRVCADRSLPMCTDKLPGILASSHAGGERQWQRTCHKRPGCHRYGQQSHYRSHCQRTRVLCRYSWFTTGRRKHIQLPLLVRPCRLPHLQRPGLQHRTCAVQPGPH